MFKKAHGQEKNDAGIDSAEQWSFTVLTEILEQYKPCNINVDETGIYYQAMPDSMLTFSKNLLSGIVRRLALVAVNVDGTDK